MIPWPEYIATVLAMLLAGWVAGHLMGRKKGLSDAKLDADVKLAETEWMDAQRRFFEADELRAVPPTRQAGKSTRDRTP